MKRALGSGITHQILEIIDGVVLQIDGQVGQSHVEAGRGVWGAELELHQDDQVGQDEASDGYKVGCIKSYQGGATELFQQGKCNLNYFRRFPS